MFFIHLSTIFLIVFNGKSFDCLLSIKNWVAGNFYYKGFYLYFNLLRRTDDNIVKLQK